MNNKYVVVNTISTFHHRYVMHVDDLQALNTDAEVEPLVWAQDTVTSEECDEFCQKHLGEQIIDASMITEDQMLKLFDADNEYLSSWTTSHKIEWVRKALERGAVKY